MTESCVKFRLYAHCHAGAPMLDEICLGDSTSAHLLGHVIAVNQRPDEPRGGAMYPEEVPRTTFLTFRFEQEAAAWWKLASAVEAEAHLLGRLTGVRVRPEAHQAAALGPQTVEETAKEELRRIAEELGARPPQQPALEVDHVDLTPPVPEIPMDRVAVRIRREMELESAENAALLERTRNNPRVIPEASSTCVIMR